MRFLIKGVALLSLALGLFLSMSSCNKSPTDSGVDLSKKGKMEGRWVAMDINSTNSFLYEFRGNSLGISTISNQNDTTLKYYGIFTLDSSATPGKLDVQVKKPSSSSGKTIATLYDYKGALGSFILCDIVPNDPGAARPADMTNALQFYFQFGSEK